MTLIIAATITLFAVCLLHEDAKRLTLFNRRLLYCFSLAFFSITAAILYVIIDIQTYTCIHTTDPRHNDYFRELMK